MLKFLEKTSQVSLVLLYHQSLYLLNTSFVNQICIPTLSRILYWRCIPFNSSYLISLRNKNRWSIYFYNSSFSVTLQLHAHKNTHTYIEIHIYIYNPGHFQGSQFLFFPQTKMSDFRNVQKYLQNDVSILFPLYETCVVDWQECFFKNYIFRYNISVYFLVSFAIISFEWEKWHMLFCIKYGGHEIPHFWKILLNEGTCIEI